MALDGRAEGGHWRGGANVLRGTARRSAVQVGEVHARGYAVVEHR